MKRLFSLPLILSCCLWTAYGQQTVNELPVIDAHTHTDFSGGPERTSGITKTQAQYFKEWSEAGVVGAVAHTSPVGANFHELKDRNVVYCAGVGLTISEGIEVKAVLF